MAVLSSAKSRMKTRLLPEDEAVDRVRKSLVLVRRGHVARRPLHLSAGVAHGDAGAGDRDHQHSIRHVTDRTNRFPPPPAHPPALPPPPPFVSTPLRALPASH